MDDLLSFLKETKEERVKEKHTLMPAREKVHDSHGLSKKLKVVIFLLTFGFVMLFTDTVLDRPKANKEEEASHSHKKKKKLGLVVIHLLPCLEGDMKLCPTQ